MKSKKKCYVRADCRARGFGWNQGRRQIIAQGFQVGLSAMLRNCT